MPTSSGLILALCLLCMSGRTQSVNFSGHWVRATEKCDAGGLSMSIIPISISMKQDEKKVSITRRVEVGNHDTATYTEAIVILGPEVTSSVKADLNRHSIMLWSNDKKSLSEKSIFDDGNRQLLRITEEWTLTDGGKTLVISSVVDIIGNSRHVMKEVFTLQS